MYHRRKKSYRYGGTINQRLGGRVKSYGLGGALLKVGSNLAQGKGFGSGALQGVGKAAITPGSGIGAGAELAGNLLQKSKNPALQGIGKGLDVASNFAPGGGGVAGAVGDIAGMAGGGAGGAGGAGGGGFGQGLMNMLQGAGGAGGAAGAGGGILGLAGQFLGAEKGMKVKLMKRGGTVDYDNGGETPPSLPFNAALAAAMNDMGTSDDPRRNQMARDNYYRSALQNRDLSLSSDLLKDMKERGALDSRETGVSFFKTPEEAAKYYIDENKRFLEGTDFYKNLTEGQGGKFGQDIYIDQQGMPVAYDKTGKEVYGGMPRELQETLVMQSHLDREGETGESFVDRSPQPYEIEDAIGRLMKEETGRGRAATLNDALRMSKSPFYSLDNERDDGTYTGGVTKKEAEEVRRLFEKGMEDEVQRLYNKAAGSRREFNTDPMVMQELGLYSPVTETEQATSAGRQFNGGATPRRGVKVMKAGGGPVYAEHGTVTPTDPQEPKEPYDGRSYFQKLADEASQIYSGLEKVIDRSGTEFSPRTDSISDLFMRGYNQQERRDRAREESGQSGRVDAFGDALAAFSRGLEGKAPTKIGGPETTSIFELTPLADAQKAYERSRMTQEARNASRQFAGGRSPVRLMKRR